MLISATGDIGTKFSHVCKMSVPGYLNPIQSSPKESTIIESVKGLKVEGKDTAAPEEILEFQFQIEGGGEAIRCESIHIEYQMKIGFFEGYFSLCLPSTIYQTRVIAITKYNRKVTA